MEKISDIDFVKYDNSKREEYIRLDTTIIGIDNLISKVSTAEEANALFKAKDVIYSQQRHFTYRQPDDGWISVKDKLPESDKIVLIYVCGHRETAYYDNLKRAFILTKDENLYFGMCVVTHWQHLPEPPKGE